MNQSKELLRQQLELLAEHSEGATEQELPNLSAAMCEIYDRLIQEGVGRSLFRSAIILVTLSNLLVSIQSETISRHSVTYFNMEGDNSSMGFPKSLLGFLKPYMKARFGQGLSV